ncbi:hypothetical protein SELMODRAFT_446768 [Selaginella moellendorffii]|uniref:J domain-containing protein n=1 Tax=Selaginella moellendorffii TaxID=88036 RepID=D8SU60_SELML|nr:chaperone protein dnaJ 15 [Selaginella moellendorffii]XP_002990068.1 chaperone protein dnaJ 15 [Selaginella moellendorffii]EFJ08891.1 hypothetical protein SELMODRAFT_447899 [Selaginella moellendorffii]EFJ12011.1 hypothetical protein SELMODRAFT_446768 [Selaginella moellendorffii]|eukprot:XP_002986929.1 chaperone protein dnaJ 15 [Selaginella moellendorffii]
MGDVRPVASPVHRDPYEVLGVPRDATAQQIKSAYRKLALRYHPDKNANNPQAPDLFKEVAYAYGILGDPEKRRSYDIGGFQAVDLDGLDMELDLSNLGTVNTMFVALFSKLGVPIKTTISAQVLEDALNGTVTIRPLPLGRPFNDKVEKQGAHFYGVTISPDQAAAGVVVRATSVAQSKFKLLYFEQEENGGLGLAIQEDSIKTGKVTSAGLYFLHFQVYRLDPAVNALAMAKDPDAAFFKKLEGLQPCEMSELKPGTHIFAVYGDNFFKAASYTIEACCVDACQKSAERLRDVEGQILAKRAELKQFETEYREVLARFAAVTKKYSEEKVAVDELLKLRESIQDSFGTAKKAEDEEQAAAAAAAEDGHDKSSKKRWFNFRADTRM